MSEQTSTPQAAAEDEVLFEAAGGVGVITLNRPKALNALSHGMVVAVREQLAAWEEDPAVRAVVVRGAGERGLCAGGDVVSLHGMITTGRAAEAMGYFEDEYAMNHAISVYPKPYVAFMDGFVLGGGVGVSAHGSHRVVTERTRIGMPETGIGFTPDVGGSWLLARAPRNLGRHLGLTSAFATGADALELGFGDVLVDSGDLETIVAALRAELGSAGDDADAAHAAVDAVLARHARPASEAPLLADAEWLEPAHAHDRVEDVLAALEATAADHADEGVRTRAAEAAETVRAKSPTAVKVTLEALRRLGDRAGGTGRREGVAAALEQEHALASHLTRGHDMAEGIRAQLVDKDRNPQWSPATVEEVSDEAVAAHFGPGEHAPLRLR